MINKVILVGNVGADPEVRTLDNGTKVARVRLATTERFYNSQTKESSDHTEWHTVTLWRGLADVADRFLRKGSQVYIEGRLRSREWTDKDGNRRFGIEILGDELKMLGRRGDSQGSSEQQQSYSNPNSQSSSAQYNQTPTPPEVVAAPQETESDDLPF